MEIQKFAEPALIQVTEEMTWEQRDAAHDANIKALSDLSSQAILLIASELYQNKFTGAYLTSNVWADDETERTWAEYLKRRDYKLTDGDRQLKVDDSRAESMMAWGAACAAIQDANGKRVEENMPLLPLPANSSQLDPYRGVLARVDDWEPEQWPENYPRHQIDPPHAEEQTAFVQKWEAVFNQLPPEKRLDKKGQPKPPARNESRDYLAKERQMLTPDFEEPTYNVGQTATTAERMAAAAAERPKPKAPPKKTQREIDEERRQYELEANARKYRMQLLSLQQQSESLEGLLKTLLVNHGSDYLEAMRDLDLGAYSVTEDVDLLRKSVTVLQSCFRLATEVYIAPEPIEVQVPDVIDV